MDRRKKLATAGAVSLTATAAVVALASSVGLFGLTDDSPRVGKLSPIDSTQTTTSTDPDDVDRSSTTRRSGTTPNTVPSTSPARRRTRCRTPRPNTTRQPADHVEHAADDGDDNSGDGDGDDDNSGPGTGGDDDNSGHGGGDDNSVDDHPEDD